MELEVLSSKIDSLHDSTEEITVKSLSVDEILDIILDLQSFLDDQSKKIGELSDMESSLYKIDIHDQYFLKGKISTLLRSSFKLINTISRSRILSGVKSNLKNFKMEVENLREMSQDIDHIKKFSTDQKLNELMDLI